MGILGLGKRAVLGNHEEGGGRERNKKGHKWKGKKASGK